MIVSEYSAVSPKKEVIEEGDFDREDALDPVELLEEIVRCLVKHPQKVAVKEIKDGTSGARTSILAIYVHPEDRGLLIGKFGRTIKVLQGLFSIVASRSQRHLVLEVAEALEGKKRHRHRNGNNRDNHRGSYDRYHGRKFNRYSGEDYAPKPYEAY